jgi:hypothetical protein
MAYLLSPARAALEPQQQPAAHHSGCLGHSLGELQLWCVLSLQARAVRVQRYSYWCVAVGAAHCLPWAGGCWCFCAAAGCGCSSAWGATCCVRVLSNCAAWHSAAQNSCTGPDSLRGAAVQAVATYCWKPRLAAQQCQVMLCLYECFLATQGSCVLCWSGRAACAACSLQSCCSTALVLATAAASTHTLDDEMQALRLHACLKARGSAERCFAPSWVHPAQCSALDQLTGKQRWSDKRGVRCRNNKAGSDISYHTCC